MKKTDKEKYCHDCIHEYACQSWCIGSLINTVATHCVNYETAKDSTAYLIGYLDGRKDEKND